MPKEPMKNRVVRVSDRVWEAAKTRADEKGESISDAVRKFLERYGRLSEDGQIAVGLSDSADFIAWLTEIGAKPDGTKILTAGVIRREAVTRWIGVPEPSDEVLSVELRSPTPRAGEAPQWLVFRPGEWTPSPAETFACWTSDLIAVRVGINQTADGSRTH